MTASVFFGVRIIAERVIMRIGTRSHTEAVELTLDEAKRCRALLDEAIRYVDEGDSVVEDFETFLSTIPRTSWPP